MYYTKTILTHGIMREKRMENENQMTDKTGSCSEGSGKERSMSDHKEGKYGIWRRC